MREDHDNKIVFTDLNEVLIEEQKMIEECYSQLYTESLQKMIDRLRRSEDRLYLKLGFAERKLQRIQKLLVDPSLGEKECLESISSVLSE